MAFCPQCPDIRFIVNHSGACVPTLAGRSRTVCRAQTAVTPATRVLRLPIMRGRTEKIPKGAYYELQETAITNVRTRPIRCPWRHLLQVPLDPLPSALVRPPPTIRLSPWRPPSTTCLQQRPFSPEVPFGPWRAGMPQRLFCSAVENVTARLWRAIHTLKTARVATRKITVSKAAPPAHS